MPRWPPPVNSRPTPWPCSPNRRNKEFDDPDHSVSAVDRARCGRRGVGCRAARRCRAGVGQSEDIDHAAEVRAGARHCHRRGDHALGDPARLVAHAGAYAQEPAREAPRPRPPRDHARIARDRPWRFQRRPRACRRRAASCGAGSAGAAAGSAIGAAQWRPRRRAARLPRHGRARGYEAARPARPVHRGAARR